MSDLGILCSTCSHEADPAVKPKEHRVLAAKPPESLGMCFTPPADPPDGSGINSRLENFHGVQWLRLLAAEAGGPGSTPGQELRPMLPRGPSAAR